MANYPSRSEQAAYREAAERGIIPEDLKTILNTHLLQELVVPKTVEPWTYEDDGCEYSERVHPSYGRCRAIPSPPSRH